MNLSCIHYGAEIAAAAARHNVDPRLLAAIAAQETGGPGSNSGNNIVGDGGHGHGVFQIDDRSWAFARTPAAMDPARNADMAATILHDNLERYGGNARMAVSAYNSGSPTAAGTATTWADGQTLSYADSVFRHYAQLGSDQQGQLLADNRDTLAGVNALATFGAARSPAVGAFEPAPSAFTAVGASGGAFMPFGAVQVPAFTPAPVTSPASAAPNSPANAAQAAADHEYASLLDSSDVYDDAATDAS